MLKRSFLIVTLLSGIVPMAASAGNVSTRVMTAGGTATMGGGTAQTSAGGTVTKFFGTGKYYNSAGVLVPQVDLATSVAFAPNTAAGYIVSEVKLNGVVQPLTSPVTVPAASKGQSVTIKFARQAVAVTANAAAGGSVIPGGTKSGLVGTPLTYLFTPFAGAKVQSIAGLPQGATLKDPMNALATVTFPYGGPVAVTFTPAAGTNVSMTPSFLAITASAGAAKTVTPGSVVTLAGTCSAAGASFAWTQVGGPSLGTPWSATLASPTLTLTAAGNYTFQLTATRGSDTASSSVLVKVIAGYTAPTALQAAKKACADCHTASGVGSGEYAKWAASTHSAKLVTCETCHIGANTGAHPGTPVTAAACESCHAAPALSQTTHPTDLTAAKCVVCHNPHDPASGIANLGTAPAHPAVTLYTFEEIGMQMAGGAKVPVQVDANGKGMPYSPKQTCGTSGCHVKNGIDYTYDKISDHAFHSSQGRSEYQDAGDGKFNATKNKPWLQSTAMVGKW